MRKNFISTVEFKRVEKYSISSHLFYSLILSTSVRIGSRLSRPEPTLPQQESETPKRRVTRYPEIGPDHYPIQLGSRSGVRQLYSFWGRDRDPMRTLLSTTKLNYRSFRSLLNEFWSDWCVGRKHNPAECFFSSQTHDFFLYSVY